MVSTWCTFSPAVAGTVKLSMALGQIAIIFFVGFNALSIAILSHGDRDGQLDHDVRRWYATIVRSFQLTHPADQPGAI